MGSGLNFTIDSAELKRGLRQVTPVAGRSRIPILNGVLVKAMTKSVRLTCSDVDLTIAADCAATVDEQAEIVLPAKLLAAYADKVSGDIKFVQQSDDVVRLSCGRARLDLKTLPLSEWPALASQKMDTGAASMVLDKAQVALLRRTLPFASTDPKRGALVAVHLNGSLAETTDSRMAARVDLDDVDLPDRCVPADALNLALDESAEKVTITLGDRYAKIAHSKCSWSTVLLPAEFPKLDAAFKSMPIVLDLNSTELYEAVDRAMPLDDGSCPLVLRSAEGQVELTMTRADVGDIADVLDSETSDLTEPLAMQSAFVLLALSAVKTERAQFEQSDPKRQVVIRGDSIDVLLMPIIK